MANRFDRLSARAGSRGRWLFAFAACLSGLAGAACAQTYYPIWSSYVGGDYGSDQVYAAAADSRTNTYVGGFLDGFTINNPGGAGPSFVPPYCEGWDGFVAKVSSSGALSWYALFGNSEYDRINALATFTNDTLYAAGLVTRSELGFTGTDAYLYALSGTNGATIWSKSFGNLGGTNAFTAVAVDASGNVYAVGYTTAGGLATNVSGYQAGGVTYGKALKGSTDAFVAKYAPNGGRLWFHYLGGTNADAATCCALGPDGSVYVGGETRSPGWTTVASTSASPTNTEGFVVKLTALGTNVWSACLGGGATDTVSAVAFDAAASALYLGGATASSNFVAGATLLSLPAGGLDGFVLRLTDLGAAFATNWCRFAGGGSADRVHALAVQPDGRLTAAGATASSGWLPAADNSYCGGAQDGFLLRLDAGGSPLWSRYVGGANSDELRALAAPAHTLLAGGSTFSPEWVAGGFWATWTKDTDFNGAPDYGAPFGLVAKWTAEQGDPPDVTDPPDDLTVNEGAPASFSVAATGNAPLFYRWFRNGQPLSAGPTSNVYALASASRTNNQDLYTCLVSNLFGTATSPAARLTVISNATLTVTLAPADAVAQGARWRLAAGGAWLATGASTNLPPGAYGVTFTNLAGWLAPASLTNLALLEGRTTATTGVYTAILPAATRAIAGTNVSVTVQAPAGLGAWTLVETLQAGLTPTNIAGGGVWNSAARTLTFSGSEATTSTVSYTALCVTSGHYSVSGAVTVQPAGQQTAVTGDWKIEKGNLIRRFSTSGGVTTVTITMYQPSSKRSWYVDELVPLELAPYDIIAPGEWDAESGAISWLRNSTAMVLTYKVACPPGSYTFSGSGNVTGLGDEPIFGDSLLVIAAPEPVPPPNILAFWPLAGTNACSLTFTSVVSQAYVILTNAAPAQTNGWAACLPVTGEAGVTQRTVPAAGPQLFYRVRAQ